MRGLVIGAALALTVHPAAAQNLEESLRAFDSASASVASGNYADAIRGFDQALSAGYENAALHYNRGIALYRLDRLGEAIASFERARRLAPDDRTIQHNLSMARSRIRDRLSELPTPFGATIRGWLDRQIGPTVLYIVGLWGYLLWCGVTLVRVIRRGYSEWMRRAAWSGAAVGLVFVALAFWLSVRPVDGPAAVVVAEDALVYPAAAATETPDLQIHEGLTVSILGRSESWTSVRLPNGVTGWVATEHLLDI